MVDKSSYNLWTIASDQPFFMTLIDGLWERANKDHEALSKMRIYLPTRRACRALQETFLNFFEGSLCLMPEICALGDMDEDELDLLSFDQELASGFLEIPKAISPVKRQMILARFLMMESDVVSTMDQAMSLAGRLGSFLDEMLIEGVSFENLKEIVPDDYSQHWQKTLSFLSILTTKWPAFLEQRGLIDPAARRNEILGLQNRIWQTKEPNDPIVIAGVTGTMPAAAQLIKTVSQMSQGMVVLPGVDLEMGSDIWQSLEPSHPQYGFKVLFDNLRVELSGVSYWSDQGDMRKTSFLREIMRPADVSQEWLNYKQDALEDLVEPLHYMICDHEDEEASLVALLTREALEKKGKTVAIITPDRTLARRISTKLKRWDLEVDDSAGVPLSYTNLGMWLLSLAEMVASGFEPVKFLSAMKHPLSIFASVNELTWLNKTYFRGQNITAKTLEEWRNHLQLKEKKITWIEDLIKYVNNFKTYFDQGNCSYYEMLQAHLTLAENLSFKDETGRSLLWNHDDGEAGAHFFHELFESLRYLEEEERTIEITPSAYVSLLKNMMSQVTVRPKYGGHPHIQILGLMESRLIDADRYILCGLNEGVWPPEAKADPFLSRHMREKVGLPSPDKMVGMSAHDFIEKISSTSELFLTRAKKHQSSPTMPARWLVRMEAILNKQGLTMPIKEDYLEIMRQQDKRDEAISIERPAPKPPIEYRPNKLSVSSIKKWMTDPYGLYADKILKLKKLDPLKKQASHSERGQFIHKCLEEFIELYPHTLDDKALETLLEIGERYIDDYCPDKAQKTFWWNRFKGLAVYFINYETIWRQHHYPILSEKEGALAIPYKVAHLPEKGMFTVHAKADRIDQNKQTKEITIIDYKSGSAPSNVAMMNGTAPQLPIEGVIAREGGYGSHVKCEVESLEHWVLKTEEKSDINQFPAKTKRKDFDMTAFLEDTKAHLIKLIEAFSDEETPYYALPNENEVVDYNDYEHLERVQEWQQK